MLTAKRVEREREPGRYRDGMIRGLYLQVSETGSKSWVLRFERDGRERMMGLGSAADYNLKEARERARAARQLLGDGIDPLAAKQAAKVAARQVEQRKLTFREAAERYFNQHESKWSNDRYRAQFLSSLKDHAFPVLADLDVADIQVSHVLRALEPNWRDKAVTLDRVRARIEAILDWCVVRGHRPAGTNAAKWSGTLDQVLPPPRKIAPVKHLAALDYGALPAFMAELRQREGTVARALEFLILTAARTSEVLGAEWREIDLDAARWEIPAERMKGRRPHTVPLSPAAVDLLRALPTEKGNPYVFIGKPGRGLPKMALFHFLRKRMSDTDTTVHGLRSAFSGWAYETTSHANHAIELALAHTVGNEAERSYRRSSMYAKRAKLMSDWARHCAKPAGMAGNVVAIGGRRKAASPAGPPAAEPK
jgi:integrase